MIQILTTIALMCSIAQAYVPQNHVHSFSASTTRYTSFTTNTNSFQQCVSSSSSSQLRQLHMVASAASPSMSSSGSKKVKVSKKKKKQTSSSFAVQQLVDSIMFFKRLPWNEERAQRQKSYKLRREAATLYRELGIAEDASFEDINEACDSLKRKYRDNKKKQIQVDIMKDKMMSLRLEQRMGGMVSATGDARAQSYLNKDAQAYRRKSKMAKTMSGPKWSRGLIQAPKKEWRETCLVMFGFMSAVGFLLNGAAKMMCFLSMIVGVGLMQSRGTASEYKLDQRGKGGVGMFGRNRSEFGWHTGQALVFGLGLFLFTYFGAQYVTFATGLQGNPIEFPLVNLMCQSIMGIAAMYMHFFKGTATKSEDYDE